VIDTGVLLEYFKLIVNSHHHNLEESEQNRLIQYIELFKGRELIIVPQVLSETYSLLKRDAKGSDSQIKHWLEILEDPHLKNLFENYIQKDRIINEKKYLEFGFTDIALMKSICERNFLLTKDFPLTQICRHRGLDAYHLEELLD
jgi:predicted nucleic acid-binding protein